MKMAKLPFPYVRAKLYTQCGEVVNRKINEMNFREKDPGLFRFFSRGSFTEKILGKDPPTPTGETKGKGKAIERRLSQRGGTLLIAGFL
jgi:hypothetical protein